MSNRRKSIFFSQIMETQNSEDPNNNYKIKNNFLVLISRIPMLSNLMKGLLKEQKDKLFNIFILKEYKEGTVLYNKGDNNNNIYVLLKGNIKSIEENIIYTDFGIIFNLNEKKNNKLCKETLMIDKKAFLFEINYSSFIIYEQLSSNQNANYFVDSLLKFDCFQKANFSQRFLEKIFIYFQLRNFKKDEYLCKEDQEMNNENSGLYFITKGNFLLSKKVKTKFSNEENLEKIKRENLHLKKQTLYLTNCLNKGIIFNTPKKNDTQKKIFLSKSTKEDIKLIILGPNNIIGDVEYFLNSKKFYCSIKCLDDNSVTFYLPMYNLKKIKNEDLINNIKNIAYEKIKISTNKFNNNLKISKEKKDISKVNIKDLIDESIPVKKINKNLITNYKFPILNKSRNVNPLLSSYSKDSKNEVFNNYNNTFNNHFYSSSYSYSKKEKKIRINTHRERLYSYNDLNDLSSNEYYIKLGIKKTMLRKSIFKTDVSFNINKDKPSFIKTILLNKPSNKIRFVLKK